ncbi:deoxyribodipyrimidine photo-lyase (single-stranded DNA-specific) [Cyanobacterium stanieri PCC 7202]|uniref:Cryptochrome DASH n=1 Tax=Cyanobacterium stanieri (strain ATCC 29140 / PCC 7202) TaxID=292563 RepID=K9YK79_CYASC|nr:deoxyribodipyrimidine photo-lyase (single-stranded DNA-specific) [Cyanobacterium stanieri PCC 7202]
MANILIWFRNDLRLHDQKCIYRAISAEPKYIIPFYCFDDRTYTQTSFGFPKTGKYRAKLIIESVTDLQKSLQKIGSNLVVKKGKTEEEISKIVEKYQITEVYFSKEATAEERAMEKKLTKILDKKQVKIKTFWQSTLYFPDDLPFSIKELPDLFTNFRKQVEKKAEVYNTFKTPSSLPPLPKNIDIGKIPTLSDLGLEEFTKDDRGVLTFMGGETEAIKRLQYYLWETDNISNYKKTRNGMLGGDYSSKFSPWLAQGCLSPRLIYTEIEKYEQERVKNDSTYWLIFELLWRDFFRFTCLKYGNSVFHKSGLQNIQIPWQENQNLFELWCQGKTGYPLIDANMRELKATGFMSNRGRQNVASFLTKNLGINWQMGAEWFESLLIDYDVCSNWGNWNYTAGVGNDARGFRYFNIPKQSKDYDYQGDYLRHWLPEIASIKGEKIHEPWKLSKEEQTQFKVQLGVTYPRPMVDFFKSVKHNEKVYLGATR